MKNRKIAAFFDFDKTLLRQESAKLGFRMIWEERQVSPFYLLKLALADQLYKRGLYSAEKVAALCLSYYQGRKLRPFVESAPRFYHEWLKPALSPAVLAKLEEHRQAGHELVLLSASVDYYLREAAADLRMPHLFCTQLATDAQGVCTGQTIGPVVLGQEKRRAAEAFAQCEGVDLAASYAYADHDSDLPLFEIIGHPVVVQPTKTLRRIAVARGWEIMEAS